MKKIYDDSVINLHESLARVNSPGEQQIYANKNIIQLEATLLDMASVPGLCKGIMYIFPVTLGNKCILR